MAFPTVTIQGVVYTATQFGKFPSISYVNGGTAGSEVVTIDPNFNIFIQIQAGTSTNTQIVAALNATKGLSGTGLGAGDLVVASTSSGSTTPLTLSLVPLSGGAVIKAASLIVGPMRVTAVTGGTGGNSIRMKFTAGATPGSEVVTVATDDITVQIADGVSSYAQVAAALIASGDAAALVAPTAISALDAAPSYVGVGGATPNNQNAAMVASLVAFTNLTGGVAATDATTPVIQGVSVVAKTTGVTANGVLITLAPGGTAGSETVAVTATGFICTIQSGTSTPTQVAAALNGNGTFTALYTANHTGSTGVIAVYEDSLGAGTGPVFAGAAGWSTNDAAAALSTSYAFYSFGGVAEVFTCINNETTGSKTVIGSWDGVNNHFSILPTQSFTQQHNGKTGVWLKEANGAPAFEAFTVNR